MKNHKKREHWQSKIGLVLAMAGNAIGLGNFLRFPGKAACYGGGAFMIPYFISLILMAIPLMWLEWAQGRYGGIRGHGTTPGMFQAMWKNPVAKYLGVLGLFIPTVILIYYTYTGIPDGEFLHVKAFTYAVFVFVLLSSVWVLARGVSRGIELMAKIAMPI